MEDGILFNCRLCPSKLDTESALNNISANERRHVCRAKRACPHCDYLCESTAADQLGDHILENHSCLCGKFNSGDIERYLRSHVPAAAGDEDDHASEGGLVATEDRDEEKREGVRCTLCERTLSRRAHLRRHVKNVHDKGRLPCATCKMAFNSEAQLRVHGERCPSTENSKGQKVPGVRCQICEKTLSSGSSLGRHVKDVHERLGECACNICGRSFTRQANLRAHVKIVHDNGRLPCATCRTILNSKAQLRVHVLGCASTENSKGQKVPGVRCQICEKNAIK